MDWFLWGGFLLVFLIMGLSLLSSFLLFQRRWEKWSKFYVLLAVMEFLLILSAFIQFFYDKTVIERSVGAGFFPIYEGINGVLVFMALPFFLVHYSGSILRTFEKRLVLCIPIVLALTVLTSPWVFHRFGSDSLVSLLVYIIFVLSKIGAYAMLLILGIRAFRGRKSIAMDSCRRCHYPFFLLTLLSIPVSIIFYPLTDFFYPESARTASYIFLIVVDLTAMGWVLVKNLVYLTGHQRKAVELENLPLSGREREVCKELLLGKSNKEIAQACNISIRTVETHLYNIYRKTSVENRYGFIQKFS